MIHVRTQFFFQLVRVYLHINIFAQIVRTGNLSTYIDIFPAQRFITLNKGRSSNPFKTLIMHDDDRNGFQILKWDV